MAELFDRIELTGLRKAQVPTRKSGTKSNHKSGHGARTIITRAVDDLHAAREVLRGLI